MNHSQTKADPPPSPSARFIRELRLLESRDGGTDRAAMAALRCGLRHPDGVAVEMMPFVAPFLPPYESPRDKHFFQIAALWALHPQNGGQSFASAFRVLADNGSDSVEKRFQLLLSSRAETLFGPLSQCVSLLKAQSLPFNWKRLLDDLFYGDWDSPDRELQLKWAREFYRKAQPAAFAPDANAPTASASTTENQF